MVHVCPPSRKENDAFRFCCNMIPNDLNNALFLNILYVAPESGRMIQRVWTWAGGVTWKWTQHKLKENEAFSIDAKKIQENDAAKHTSTKHTTRLMCCYFGEAINQIQRTENTHKKAPYYA